MKKLVCINNDTFSNLTIGAEYYLVDENETFYYIKDNRGIISGFFKSRFITVKENRKLKLLKINEI